MPRGSKQCPKNCTCGRHRIPICIEGCTCLKHTTPKKGKESPNWISNPTLHSFHSRLKRMIGSASQFQCVDCKKQARDWSQIKNTSGFEFDHYEPRCRSCHMKYDGGSFGGRKHTEETKRKISNTKRRKTA